MKQLKQRDNRTSDLERGTAALSKPNKRESHLEITLKEAASLL